MNHPLIILKTMNKILLTIAAAVAICFSACAQKTNKNEMKAHHTLVAYFSATGTTAKAAQSIANATNGTLYEIAPQTPYTSADLNWNDKQSRSSVEMGDKNARPALKEAKADLTAYDVVFIGYPIWWDEAPRIVNTFIENNDLKGKTLIPFATSGGSGIANSVKALRQTYPDLNWKEGRLLNRASDKTIREWLNANGL